MGLHQDRDKRAWEKALYIMAFFASSLPLWCGYILKDQQVPDSILQMGENAYWIYLIYMLLIQGLTLVCNSLFYNKIFAGKEAGIAGGFGVLLYMTCPYHIFVCYDRGDWLRVWVGILLPLAGIGFMGIWQKKKVLLNGLVFCAAVAGIIKVNCYDFVIAPGVGNYTIADLLGCWHYRGGRPGLGMGVLLAVIPALWLWFVERKRDEIIKVSRIAPIIICLVLLLLFTNMSQWVGCLAWFLCIWGAWACGELSHDPENPKARGILLLILMAALGCCWYQCNTLTYTRMPMIFF